MISVFTRRASQALSEKVAGSHDRVSAGDPSAQGLISAHSDASLSDAKKPGDPMRSDPSASLVRSARALLVARVKSDLVVPAPTRSESADL